MDNHRLAGRLLMAALPGPDLPPPVLRSLADLAPAGIILFARNLKSPRQTIELIQGIRETSPWPLLLGVDQEGGRVNRLKELDPLFNQLPEARQQALWGEAQLETVWAAVGAALAALGIDIDFAPVVDLDAGPGGNAIGPRSFGLDPERTADLAAAVLRGLEQAGVAGCLKHFPGLGGTDLDTHQTLATSPHPLATLERLHLQPFRRLASQTPLVMTAHAHFPAFDGPEPLPATFSRRILNQVLREEIGFGGLVITDDLEMGAVADRPPGARALTALTAGADLALFCHDLDQPRIARDDLARALADGRLGETTAAQSQARLAGLLGRFPGGRRAGHPGRTAWEEALSRLTDAL